jgi:hypothetical protein
MQSMLVTLYVGTASKYVLLKFQLTRISSLYEAGVRCIQINLSLFL